MFNKLQWRHSLVVTDPQLFNRVVAAWHQSHKVLIVFILVYLPCLMLQALGIIGDPFENFPHVLPCLFQWKTIMWRHGPQQEHTLKVIIVRLVWLLIWWLLQYMENHAWIYTMHGKSSPNSVIFVSCNHNDGILKHHRCEFLTSYFNHSTQLFSYFQIISIRFIFLKAGQILISNLHSDAYWGIIESN